MGSSSGGRAKSCRFRNGGNRVSTLAGCYFFCFSKRSNQEKETEIGTRVNAQPAHEPKISAGMYPPIDRHSSIGQNLNARDNAASPHRHRFPGLGSTMAQRFSLPIATEIVGSVRLENDPVRLIPVQLHKSIRLTYLFPHRNFGMCVGA